MKNPILCQLSTEAFCSGIEAMRTTFRLNVLIKKARVLLFIFSLNSIKMFVL